MTVIALRPREMAARLMFPSLICPLEAESGIQAVGRWIVGAGLVAGYAITVIAFLSRLSLIG